MSAPIKLSDLQAQLDAMRTPAGVYADAARPVSAGYVALREAAPVLLEIAFAARTRAYVECTCGAELGCFPDCALEVASVRLLAAVAKVLP
jgi:hypothetical protein